MSDHYFSGYAITKELNLNTIAKHFNINKKFNWEDYLKLDSIHLKDLISSPDSKSVHIYSFGSVVFINFSDDEKAKFIKYLENNFNTSRIVYTKNFYEDYTLKINPDSDVVISNNYVTCSELKDGYMEILSLILARSVALNKIEDGIYKVIDEVEKIIEYLETGKLNISDESLAKLSSKILSFRYTSISDIMILDKPYITWENIKYDEFYNELIDLFEIKDRYNNLKGKLSFLMDVTEIFASLTHEKRAARLEWMIIILIAIEIVIYIFELLLH